MDADASRRLRTLKQRAFSTASWRSQYARISRSARRRSAATRSKIPSVIAGPFRHDRSPSTLPIFNFWEPAGTLPPYLALCKESWRQFGSIEIIDLDYSNAKRYCTIPDDDLKRFPLAQQADFIRFAVLAQNGGIWLDLDTICLRRPNTIIHSIDENELTLIGRDGKNAFMGFIGVASQANAFVHAVLEDKWRLVSSDLPEPLPWDFLGKPFYDRVRVGDYCGSKANVIDFRLIDVFPEATHGPGYGFDGYRTYYFNEPVSLRAEEYEANGGLIMLHNSWTPAEYRALSRKHILTLAPNRLSQFLRLSQT